MEDIFKNEANFELDIPNIHQARNRLPVTFESEINYCVGLPFKMFALINREDNEKYLDIFCEIFFIYAESSEFYYTLRIQDFNTNSFQFMTAGELEFSSRSTSKKLKSIQFSSIASNFINKNSVELQLTIRPKSKDVVNFDRNSILKSASLLKEKYLKYFQPEPVSESIRRLWESKDFADFTFNINEKLVKYSFPVHKNILSVQSPVFEAMFNKENNMKEAVEESAIITDCCAKAFTQLLDYIYLRKVPKFASHSSLIIDLYSAAVKYQIENLPIICEMMILSKVTSRNAFEFYQFATIFDKPLIKRLAFFKIKEIIVDKDLPDKLLNKPDAMEQIFKAHKAKIRAIRRVSQEFDKTTSDVIKNL